MKDLKNLLDTVAIATAPETKKSIQEGVLSVIRNNSIIDFDTALKLLTMATNIKDHNTVVKLNTMLSAYFPVGESMEDILDNAAQPTNEDENMKQEFTNESFDALSESIGRFFKATAGGEDHKEVKELLGKFQGALHNMAGIGTPVVDEEFPHADKIILPFPIDTLSVSDLDDSVLSDIAKVEASYKLVEESNVVEFVKSVIRTLKLHEMYNLGDSVISHIIDYYSNLFNKNTDEIISMNLDDLAIMRETLFASYVVHQLSNREDIVKGSQLDRMLKDAVELVDETLDTGWSEVINYNNKWAIICNDNMIVLTAEGYESASNATKLSEKEEVVEERKPLSIEE